MKSISSAPVVTFGLVILALSAIIERPDHGSVSLGTDCEPLVTRPASATARNQTSLRSMCVVALDSIAIRFESAPLGCRLVDCCPGCPATPPIDLRLSIQTDGLADVQLHLEGVPDDMLRHMQPAVERVRSGVGRIAVPIGETWLRGYERRPGVTPIVTPVISLDSVALAAAAASAPGTRIGEVVVTIEQRFGELVFAEYSQSLLLVNCDLSESTGDTVHLSNNNGDDDAVVFVDARDESGCTNDQVFEIRDHREVPNYLKPGSCRSEVAVFSDNDAVQVYENVDSWTDLPGDVMGADLSRPRWQVPVNVWIAVPPQRRGQALQDAKDEIRLADELYNVNHAGIDVLGAVRFRTVGNRTKIKMITDVLSAGRCDQLGSLLSDPSVHVEKELNVYYVDIEGTGWTCPDYDPIWIGSQAQPETLAHELGHAFSLEHTNMAVTVSVDHDSDGDPDFEANNIMWAEVGGRDSFTEAQGFRMNVNPNSALNDLSVRTSGPTRQCPDSEVSDSCPWLGAGG